MNQGHKRDSRDAMKVLVAQLDTGTASSTCRNRPRVTGGTGGQVSGSGEVVDGDIFRHSRELSSCDSDSGITTKIPLFVCLDRYDETAHRFQ